MNREKPPTVLTPWVKGEPLAYECSQCCRLFLLPEDQTPKEGVAELRAALKEHVHKGYPEGSDETKGSAGDPTGKT